MAILYNCEQLGKHIFFTTNAGFTLERLRIENNGSVGIGTTNPGTYLLNVGGTLNTSGTITTSGEIITTSVRLAIVGSQPTLYLRHTNSAYRSVMIDCNGNLLYFLGTPYGGTPTQDNWATVGSGQWPLTLNLTNNEANFGGAISTPSNITTSATLYYSGGSAGTALNLAANYGYAEVRVIRNSTSGYDHDMYINYAAGGGSRTRIYSNNSQTILCEYNNVYMNSGGYTYTGQINSVFYSRSMSNTDYLCIGSNTALGSYTSSWIDVAYGSFTAFHRCYTDDVLNTGENDETIDLFKNNYMGRVVIATGKIKTDSTRAKEPEPDKPKNEPISQEWYSSIDKDGISSYLL